MPKKVKKLFTSVSFKQSLIVLVPMIIVSTFGVVFFSHSLVNGMKNEILRGMFSACASYRETITMRNGEADGSQLEDLLKADTGMDFTYFEGAERAALILDRLRAKILQAFDRVGPDQRDTLVAAIESCLYLFA